MWVHSVAHRGALASCYDAPPPLKAHSFLPVQAPELFVDEFGTQQHAQDSGNVDDKVWEGWMVCVGLP